MPLQLDLFMPSHCAQDAFMRTYSHFCTIYSPRTISGIFPRQPSGRKAPLSLFLRTLIDKPELAKFVKIYHWCAIVCDKAIVVPEPRIDISPLDEETVWTLIARKMPEVGQGVEDGRAWFGSLRLGNWEAITALILSLCLNIEELGFRGWAHGDTAFLHPPLRGPM